MTAREAFEAQPGASQRTVLPKTLNGVARARRLEAAHSADERRERPLIDSNEQNERLGEHSRARSLRRLATLRQPRFAVPPVFLCFPESTTDHSGGIPPLGHDACKSQAGQWTTRDDNQLQAELPIRSERPKRFTNQAFRPISYDSVPDALRDNHAQPRLSRSRSCMDKKRKMNRIDASGFTLDAKILRALSNATRRREPTPWSDLSHVAYFL
jgi:hypothetical protein